jgi:tetratricopeptide (TPR) repeat protein
MKSILFVVFFILTFYSCGEEKADLNAVDSLITVGEYLQAGKILHNFEMRSYDDTIQVKRIKARIEMLKRKRLFRLPDKFISERKWQKAEKSLDSLRRSIDRINKTDRGQYLFDYYYRRSIVDSALGDLKRSVNDMESAVEYPTKEHEDLWRIYEKLAFYYAEKEKFVKARENLDKALRKTNFNKIPFELQRVFSYYMNGEFVKARDSLKILPDSVKDKHWKTAERFFNKYGDKLTMEDRFRLW